MHLNCELMKKLIDVFIEENVQTQVPHCRNYCIFWLTKSCFTWLSLRNQTEPLAASLESQRVLTVPVERMERYFGAVLHTDLVAGLHFMSVWSSTPFVSPLTAARSPNAWCTTDFCRWCLVENSGFSLNDTTSWHKNFCYITCNTGLLGVMQKIVFMHIWCQWVIWIYIRNIFFYHFVLAPFKMYCDLLRNHRKICKGDQFYLSWEDPLMRDCTLAVYLS